MWNLKLQYNETKTESIGMHGYWKHQYTHIQCVARMNTHFKNCNNFVAFWWLF